MKKVLMDAAAALAMMSLTGCYTAREFEGDAALRVNKDSSWPRYTIQFAEVDLAKEGRHEFSFVSPPPVEWRFRLDVAQENGEDGVPPTDVDVVLRSGDGIEIGHASGSLVDGWVQVDSGRFRAFLHPALDYFRMPTDRTYVLVIKVHVSKDATGSYKAVPRLRGGGIRL